jgi:hypothetical protein
LRREQPVCYEDHTDDTTHVIPVGNYVIVDLRNYVIGNPSNLGNYKIADSSLRPYGQCAATVCCPAEVTVAIT